MSIKYYIIPFYPKQADGNFRSKPLDAITNDDVLRKEVLATGRWGHKDAAIASKEIQDIAALKALIGPEAEETSSGCWSTHGRELFRKVRIAQC